MKTEKEKMVAGEFYNAGDAELVAERQFAREQIASFNQTLDKEKRTTILRKLFGQVGQNIMIEPALRVDYGYNLYIGANFFANFNCVFLDDSPIMIGDNCMFGPNVQLYTACHPLEAVPRNNGVEFSRSIKIGHNVWIGGSAVILPGVTLGDNVVVAAGSVVTKSFSDNIVIGGKPARILKTIEN